MKSLWLIIITVLETAGIIAIAVGLGGFAALAAGRPAFYLTAGVVFVLAAGLAARRLEAEAAEQRQRVAANGTPRPPVTRSVTPERVHATTNVVEPLATRLWKVIKP